MDQLKRKLMENRKRNKKSEKSETPMHDPVHNHHNHQKHQSNLKNTKKTPLTNLCTTEWTSTFHSCCLTKKLIKSLKYNQEDLKWHDWRWNK